MSKQNKEDSNFLDELVLSNTNFYQPEDDEAEPAELSEPAEPSEPGEPGEPSEPGEPAEPSEPGEEAAGDDEFPVEPLIKLLHEHNGWELNEDEIKKYENNPEGLMNFIKDVIDSNVSAKEYASEDVKAFNEFVEKGGEAKKFLETYYGNDIDFENIDVADEANAIKVYREYLKQTTKFSDAKIDKEIKTKIDLEELQDEIQEAKEFLINLQKEKKENLVKEIEAQKKEEIEAQKNFLKAQETRINSLKEISGVKIDETTAKKLYEFSFVPDKTGKTGYQKLRESDSDLDLKLLYLAMTSLNGKNSITKKAESKAALELKKKLSNFTDKTAKQSTNISPEKGNDKSKINYNQFLI